MSNPIETTDVKEAALHVILKRLQEIDAGPGSRGAFASNIVMNQMYNGTDKPVFEKEIELIQRALGLEVTAKKEEEVLGNAGPAKEFMLGDL